MKNCSVSYKKENDKLPPPSPPYVDSIVCVCHTMWSAENDWRG